MRTLSYITAFILLASFISGCSTTGKFEVSKLNEVKDDEIIIVGKIKLDPLMNNTEQPLEVNPLFALLDNPAKYKNKIFLVFGKKHINIAGHHYHSSDTTSVNLEKTFFIKTKRTNVLFYSGGVVRLHMSTGGDYDNSIYFPGGLKYHIKPDDKAVYVGTIQYYRDFGEVEKVNLKNEYREASKEFNKLFGTGIQLKQLKPNKV